MFPPIMLALGFSPVASVGLPYLGYDPLTSISLLAVPITLPATVFGFDPSVLGRSVALFLPVISTGFAPGMHWIADGFEGIRKGILPAVTAGLTLGFSALLFVNIFPSSAIGHVGEIASAIAPAKIINAAAVIDQIGIEGEVIRKSAVVANTMVLVTAGLLLVILAFQGSGV